MKQTEMPAFFNPDKWSLRRRPGDVYQLRYTPMFTIPNLFDLYEMLLLAEKEGWKPIRANSDSTRLDFIRKK